MRAQPDRLAELLADGWVTIGYDVNVLAAGAMLHSMLLQRGRGLVGVTIGYMGQKEVSRVFHDLSIDPEP